MDAIRMLQESEPSVIEIEIILIISLLLISVIALLERRFRFPYTVALVTAGLLLAFSSNVLGMNTFAHDLPISSELILAFFVPPLIFEGALHINWKTFRNNLVFILLMSVAGVLISTFIIGGLVFTLFSSIGAAAEGLHFTQLAGLTGIPLVAAVAFGALISATDPVAVITFFRSLGVNKRLAVLVEGESLLNDGTSIVIFNLALALGGTAVLSTEGITNVAEFSIPMVVWQFIQVALGGITVGLIVAYAANLVLERTDNRLVETTIMIPAAFGAYLLAEQLHLSGILSVVAAGIYLGESIPNETTPTTKLALYNFWEVFSYIVTSLIFLMIGWLIDIRQFFTLENLLLVSAAIIAIIITRSLVVYGMSWIGNNVIPAISRLRGNLTKQELIPASYQHVMFWGGLRGAISLALALSLGPDTFGPGVGDKLRLMTFGVVLFTLLVQGTTIERLIKRLGLAGATPRKLEQEHFLGQYYATLAAQDELNRLRKIGFVPTSIWEAIKEAQVKELARFDKEVRDMLHRYPRMEMELVIQTRRLMLQAERSALSGAIKTELISDETLEKMVEDLDARIETIDLIARQNSSPSVVSNPDREHD